MTNSPTFRVEDLDPVDAAVIVAIWRFRFEHGEGPAWFLVGRWAGWELRREMPERLHRLRNSGLVSFSTEPRSITVPRSAVELAVQRLRAVEGAKR